MPKDPQRVPVPCLNFASKVWLIFSKTINGAFPKEFYSWNICPCIRVSLKLSTVIYLFICALECFVRFLKGKVIFKNIFEIFCHFQFLNKNQLQKKKIAMLKQLRKYERKILQLCLWWWNVSSEFSFFFNLKKKKKKKTVEVKWIFFFLNLKKKKKKPVVVKLNEVERYLVGIYNGLPLESTLKKNNRQRENIYQK